ncbi:MAG: hypothetical protein KKD77_21795 [Gammaproteobacteria bacterium]|nr:hypothetical protein [Gammaproteobacteria bacterium]
MTIDLITELDEILSLLESELPGSLKKPANAKLERDLERTMSRYFQSLNTAMPDLSDIYYRNVEQG